MRRTFFGLMAIAIVLAIGVSADAQVITVYRPATGIDYVPAPLPVTTYYAPQPVTTYYAPEYAAPVTTYYAPEVAAPVTTYYAPTAVPVTTYYAPRRMTTYYAPAPVAVNAYYAPAPMYVGAPAVVRTKVYYPGQPVRNFFRAVTP
jgi:hypothetical protein